MKLILIFLLSVLISVNSFVSKNTQKSFLGDTYKYSDVNVKTLKNSSLSQQKCQATLKAFPSKITNGGSVTVSWSGIVSSSSDIIAIYCPFNGTTDIGDFLDYKSVGSKSSGSVDFHNLYNMRCDYGFRYFRHS